MLTCRSLAWHMNVTIASHIQYCNLKLPKSRAAWGTTRDSTWTRTSRQRHSWVTWRASTEEIVDSGKLVKYMHAGLNYNGRPSVVFRACTENDRYHVMHYQTQWPIEANVEVACFQSLRTKLISVKSQLTRLRSGRGSTTLRMRRLPTVALKFAYRDSRHHPSRTVSHPSRTVSRPSRTVSRPSWTVSRPSRTVSRPSQTVSRPSRTVSRPSRTHQIFS